MRTYNELITLPTFEERFKYLELGGTVGEQTFGGNRYLNQAFYRSKEWKRVRELVIIRDNGCDLGVDGYEIHDRIYIHHIEPITQAHLAEGARQVLDLNNLICVSFRTHQAIHYGSVDLLPRGLITRQSGDTCPWR